MEEAGTVVGSYDGKGGNSPRREGEWYAGGSGINTGRTMKDLCVPSLRQGHAWCWAQYCVRGNGGWELASVYVFVRTCVTVSCCGYDMMPHCDAHVDMSLCVF